MLCGFREKEKVKIVLKPPCKQGKKYATICPKEGMEKSVCLHFGMA